MRDDLPDLLWPVLTLSELGTAEAVRFVRWQEAVQKDLSEKAEQRFIAECLDGRLTSLDRLAAQVPEAKAVVKTHCPKVKIVMWVVVHFGHCGCDHVTAGPTRLRWSWMW